tara:strand:+ start:451 stop:1842 length:1392 start_codon:yes stop_codon:yes gene_type:complete
LSDFNVIVLGSGPGGYVAAIRSAQLGLKTLLVEKSEIGGVCLNWGCIPSKALIRNSEVVNLFKNSEEFGISADNIQYDYSKAVDRSRNVVTKLTSGIDLLLSRNGVTVIKGEGTLIDRNTISVNEQRISSENIIIATGATFREIQGLPIDGNTIITSRDALALKEVPKRVVIVGAGATGVEFGYVWNTYGSEVTLVELMPRIIPNEDEESSKLLERSFLKKGIKSITSSKVVNVEISESETTVTISNDTDTTIVECDKILVAIGTQGNITNIGIEELGIDTEKDFISVNDQMETSVPGIYAIGDVTGKMLLAHVASAQAVTAVEHIAGLDPQPIDYGIVPRAIYCKPQIASFGLTEKQAIEQGYEVRIGKFPIAANGKALGMNEAEGMVKLVLEAEIGDILGAHMVGPEVTELLGELSMARMLESTDRELGWLIHPHPTISESIKEAALDSTGEAIHIYRANQ